MKQKSIYFYITVLGIFLGICSPFLFAYGMFLDGTTYAAIARNMALGKGTFWMPHYTETLHSVFYEQPPLALWMESLFFRIFGTSIFVERFYSVLSILFVGFLIVKIWKEITSEADTAWFPVLLFICFPIITWTATNNMLENTMSVFICCSIFCFLKGIRKKNYYFTIFSGLMLFLGTLCKGVVAFFPWAFPFLIWIFSKKISFRQAAMHTFLFVIATLLPLILLYVSWQDAKFFFDTYLSKQLVSSIMGLRETSGSRFLIISKLCENSIICLILAAGIFIAQMKQRKVSLMKEQVKNSLVLFFLSLCGVLPIMLSLKQSGYYIVPAYPFLAIAFALPFQAFIKEWQDKINKSSPAFWSFKILSCVLLLSIIVYSFSQKEKISRDKRELHLVLECSKYIPSNTTISIDDNTYSDWGLHAYFARYKNISLDCRNEYLFYLHDRNFSSLKLLDDEYTHLIDIENFTLYKKIIH